MDDRPGWSRRLASEREARQWSQADAINAMRMHSDKELPSDESLLRQWKRWEAGDTQPSAYYKGILAATFGTVTAALFPQQGRRDGQSEIVAATGLETLDIVSRMQASDVDTATLEALKITADRLASEYPYMPSEQLVIEGRQWLRRVAGMQSSRLTLSQHREILVIAGWLALLVACVEFDLGDARSAEATRKAALSLGVESGHTAISGWSHEIRAWMALTRGDYRGVVAAAQEGVQIAGAQDVAVQLTAQRAKAWARLGDRRQVELALEDGRSLLEGLPHPENLDNHFAIDPSKFDFYAMDCYRLVGEDRLASSLARQVIASGTDFDGTPRSPMRIAEANVTLGVAAAREGDLEGAGEFGDRAFNIERRSIPSLLMVGRDLEQVLQEMYPKEATTHEFNEKLRAVSGQIGS